MKELLSKTMRITEDSADDMKAGVNELKAISQSLGKVITAVEGLVSVTSGTVYIDAVKNIVSDLFALNAQVGEDIILIQKELK